jgi:cell division protein FtsB
MQKVNRRRKKKKSRGLMYSNWSVFLLCIVTFFLGYQVFGLHKKWSVSESKRAAAAAELHYYIEEEQSLRERIEQIQTPEGRERAIRERFNVIKEGEGVIYVVEEDNAFGSGIILDREPAEKKNLLESIRAFFTF